MKQPLTVYRAVGKTSGLIFLFKYDLNGILRAFQIEEGEMNDEQLKWLYSQNFPARENLMKSNWMKLKKYRDKFNVERSPADLTFDTLWENYNHKMKKAESLKKFNKLKEDDLIACFVQVPKYIKSCQRRNVSMTNLATFIHQKYYLDDWDQV